MKNLFFIVFIFLSLPSFSQVGVSYHQSSIPFAGVNFQFNERIISELRLGVNEYLDNVGVEVVGQYVFTSKPILQTYAGIGLRVNVFEGVVIPLGMHIYPFDVKNFGFHAEVAPIISDSVILRGSWGIRYRFGD